MATVWHRRSPIRQSDKYHRLTDSLPSLLRYYPGLMGNEVVEVRLSLP
jgi:hypothetical protein